MKSLLAVLSYSETVPLRRLGGRRRRKRWSIGLRGLAAPRYAFWRGRGRRWWWQGLRFGLLRLVWHVRSPIPGGNAGKTPGRIGEKRDFGSWASE